MTQPLSLPLVDWIEDKPQSSGRVLEQFDAVVIGSGYGGSVAALRLAEQGYRVVLLERGAEFLPGEFPNDFGQLPKQFRAQGRHGVLGSLSGIYDGRIGLGIAALVANGLGGGSLINAGVMMRPDPDVFAQPAWPAGLRHGLDERSANPHLGLDHAFATAGAMLGGEVFHDRGQKPGEVSSLAKAQTLRRVGQTLETDRQLARQDSLLAPNELATSGIDFRARPATVTIDLDKCTRCGDCASGCNVPDAKKTLTTNYLRRAYAAGAELVTRCLVYSLAPMADGRWTLRVLPTEFGNHALTLSDVAEIHGKLLTANLVVLAAGTFGSTELLLRSRDLSGEVFKLSPALGTRLSGNGDSITVLADLPEAVNGIGHGTKTGKAQAEVGPTITTLLDLRDHPTLQKRVVIQEGAVPGALGRVYQEILATSWMLRHLGMPWRSPRSGYVAQDPLAATETLALGSQLLLTMGHDDSGGRIVWVPDMNAAVPYWERPQDANTYQRQQQLFDAAERGSDGVHMHSPLWRALAPRLAALFAGPNPSPTALSVHPLGGCPMSDGYETGVVNHRGQVWKEAHAVWANLYVLDGSIVPTSLGCNPLWTITALAERAMQYHATGPLPPSHGKAPRPALPPRSPAALQRDKEPAFDMQVHERLEKETLLLHGSLCDAFRLHKVESDLRVEMRNANWTQKWDEDRLHQMTGVSGHLRLVEKTTPSPGPSGAGGRTDPAPRRLEYRITGGHVDLFGFELPWFLLGAVARVFRTLRVGITWWLLRGYRDRARAEVTVGWRDWLLALRYGWQVAEERHVRYDLQLELARAIGVENAPPRLRLRGIKQIGYAASWAEIVTHLVQRSWQAIRNWRPLSSRPAGVRNVQSWDQPARRRPGDLRASLLHQLTQPVVRLDDVRSWAAWWPTWLFELVPEGLASRFPCLLAGCATARFDFDQREVLQHSPARLFGGGDTSAALLAAVAYPALLSRYLLLTRLLEFRRPAYSGRPVLDDASVYDVALRDQPPGAAMRLVLPEEIRLHVKRGRSSSDDGCEDPAELVLRLWRYRRTGAGSGESQSPETKTGDWCGMPVRRAKSVLLMHAFDMSGYAYTFKQTERNFAEHMYGRGWEVWILDSRMSPRTSASMEPSTMDQLGLIDAPAAVEHIIARLNQELPGAGEPARPPLQIYSFAQCMGAAAMLIGLLNGKLSYTGLVATGEYESANGERPVMPMLAGLVTSQTHPFIVGSRGAQSKTWVPAMVRDWAGRTMVPLGLRSGVDSVVEAWADRLFAGLPVPDGERCHGEGEIERADDDDCATCRRVRFLLGSMFSHDNLNWETHRALPKLFGAGSVRLFAHGAKFFTYERLCSEDGHNVYVTEEALGKYLALPIRFVHGELNDLFHFESATRSAKQYRRIHPRWADRYGLSPGAAREPGLVCDVIAAYSHLDVLIGRNAMHRPDPGTPSVYERLGQLLEDAWAQPVALPPARRAGGTLKLVARFPKAGPFMGPMVGGPNGREFTVAFIIDDRTSEAAQSDEGGAGALVWLGGARTAPRYVRFCIDPVPFPVPARDGFYFPESPNRPARVAASTGLRVAHGRIALPAEAIGVPLQIECFSFAYAGMRAGSPGPGPMGGADAVLSGTFSGPGDTVWGAAAPKGLARVFESPQEDGSRAERVPIDPPLEELQAAMRERRREARQSHRDNDRPFPATLSELRRRPPGQRRRVARMPSYVLANPGANDPVRVALGCCRYGGFPLDEERADESFRRLQQQVRRGLQRPELLLMVGDQIYADRTAGLVDPLSPTERFLYRHQQAFTTWGLHELMARLPTVCLPDDHEFIDAYPFGRPLFRPRRGRLVYAAVREAIARDTATKAIHAYQMMTLPATARSEGWCVFERGGVRFFVLDTRLHRKLVGGRRTILNPHARAAFESWLVQGSVGTALHCLVTASVVLPGLVPGADPANAGPPDSMQACKAERGWLLEKLVHLVPRRFVLVSGDYHVSFAGDVRCDGARVGALVVAPPFYAPLTYANATPQDLWLDETIPLSVGTITVGKLNGEPAKRGSGFGMLTCQRGANGWTVRLSTDLIDFDGGGGGLQDQWPACAL